ncbi:RNA polymerase sigma factor [Ferruginibacter albus]|uniref:RNA polymerase sigma factor n=1 Tax=Ferruginibacter albus TaxID=2875540 RepID=UPI001CC4BA25|nr:sigma-70 family RNA polymerase sigma factor [Ferruginibacter albus]UAY51119.1 sigma-70 family RNA polymerase sigma factor [Ferruginibacter albus]
MSSDKYKHIDDNQLLQLFYTDKNNEWLGILLQRYTLLLLGVCMKYLKNEEEAKDAVQQIFLKVISELHKYKVDYFKSWLYMVAKNYCLMQLRNKDKQFKEIKENLLNAPDEEIKNAVLEKDTTLNNMESALEQLNAEQRECVTLFYLQKKSYQEITGITGYSLLQVKSYIQNGKRNLKIMLQQLQKNE